MVNADYVASTVSVNNTDFVASTVSVNNTYYVAGSVLENKAHLPHGWIYVVRPALVNINDDYCTNYDNKRQEEVSQNMKEHSAHVHL